MHEKTYFLPVFLISICLVFCLIFLGQFGFLGFFTSSVQNVFFPLGQLLHSKTVSLTSQTNQLQEENKNLREQLANKNAVSADNAALRDQFETTNPSPQQLLPVAVVGMPNGIPNISFPETLIIHAGSKEGIENGSVVVVKNEVVGVVSTVSLHFSVVQLVASRQSSFPAKTLQTGAIGVARGNGNGDIVMDNVLLSQNLQNNDTVVTKGSQDLSGKGLPPDLVVGKIVSIDKNPSSLFQKARLIPLIAFDRLTVVFVIKP